MEEIEEIFKETESGIFVLDTENFKEQNNLLVPKFRGKAIYEPNGKAAEYAEYACNFYVGCSNHCTYCFLRKGIGKKTLGGNEPTLKKRFKDEDDALRVFEKELKQNLTELQQHGLFFSFTTDPMLPETQILTDKAVLISIKNDVPVKILTKNSNVVGYAFFDSCFQSYKKLIAIGFTLTGHDELEPNASPNAERIEAMRKLHEAGFKTWASIEPVIDFESSKLMICESAGFCHLHKIGLESGKKYDKSECRKFIEWTCAGKSLPTQPKIYFKDGLLKAAGINREELPKNCVGRDYSLFNN
jgi:DNA repair photolyase